MTQKKWTLKMVKDRCERVGDCWVWLQASIRGYPQAWIEGKGGSMVRRWVWEAAHGKPAGRGRIVNTCGDTLCCNPDHLRLRTQSSVVTKGWASGKRDRDAHARRSRANMPAKIDMATARAIRADPRPAAEVAAYYGISRSCVYDVRGGRSWRELRTPVSSVFELWRAIP